MPYKDLLFFGFVGGLILGAVLIWLFVLLNQHCRKKYRVLEKVRFIRGEQQRWFEAQVRFMLWPFWFDLDRDGDTGYYSQFGERSEAVVACRRHSNKRNLDRTIVHSINETTT